MRAILGLVATLILSTVSAGCLGAMVPFPKFHGNAGGIITGNSFAYKPVLQQPKEGLQFAFILVRHGMVAPGEKPYELDMYKSNFGTTWKPNTATKRGNQLMNMIGRSLKTRYKKYLDNLSWDQISLTTMEKAWTVTNGEYLLQGLLHETAHKEVLEMQRKGEPSNTRINKEGRANFDMESSSPCKWFHEIEKELDLELDIPGNAVTLKYCTKKFYTELRKFVITNSPENKKDNWWIDSPMQVFKLWEMLWFEVQEGMGLYTMPQRYWANILACVFEYNRLKLDWHPDMAPVFVGRMFNKIKEEKEKGEVKFHIHITDGSLATNFMWNLPGNPRTLWLDYGDALILEFYEDESVIVSFFSGMLERHKTIHTFKYEELKNHFTEKGLDLTMEEYQTLCTFKPKG